MACTEFFGRGKLLLSGEYLVLDGAEALALGLNAGQRMRVEETGGEDLRWESCEADGSVWFSARYDARGASIEASDAAVAERLSRLLTQCRALSPDFSFSGKRVTVQADFDRSWGLGSSSTLIYLLGRWAGVDPFCLVRSVWPGSGYDVACAGLSGRANALMYRLSQGRPVWEERVFRPRFADRLFFVYSGAKQDTAAAVARYRQLAPAERAQAADSATRISRVMAACADLSDFETLVREHESLVGALLGIEPVQRRLFPDYRAGAVKSLGAWGGDFLLATGEEAPAYFRSRGLHIVLPFGAMTMQ